MKIIAIVLAVLFIGSVEAKTPKYWTCTDAAGHKSAQDFPCPEPLAPDAAQSATQTMEVSPPIQPQVQQQAVSHPQHGPLKVDVAGGILKPLAPLFWMFVLGLLSIFVIKAWIAAKLTKAKVKIGAKVERDVIARIEPTDDLLIKGYRPEIAVPISRPTVWSLDLIYQLEWKRFEELCEGYWRTKGYRAELTGKGADGGVDVNLYSQSNPTRLFAVIQCKAQVDQVGVEKVRELWGVANHFKADMAMFYGRSGYTDGAKKFAEGKHFKLFSGEDLLANIQALSLEQQKALLEQVTRDDYTTPSCARCDVKRVIAGNGSWRCPQCGNQLRVRAQ